MARKKKTEIKQTRRPIESYEHRDRERVNNPPVGLVTPQTDLSSKPSAWLTRAVSPLMDSR